MARLLNEVDLPEAALVVVLEDARLVRLLLLEGASKPGGGGVRAVRFGPSSEMERRERSMLPGF